MKPMFAVTKFIPPVKNDTATKFTQPVKNDTTMETTNLYDRDWNIQTEQTQFGTQFSPFIMLHYVLCYKVNHVVEEQLNSMS